MPNVTTNAALIDAGPLIALFNPRDADHTLCKRFFESFSGELITTWPVLTESAYMLSDTVNAPRSLLQWVERGGLDVRHLGLESVRSMIAYTKKYRDLPMDLADASLVALSIETGIERIICIDSDFNVYRLLNGKPLVNLLQP
jgi:uncharacterized protein